MVPHCLHTQRRRGFTLIEVLIVIVVIATLAVLVIPQMLGAQRKAKEAQLSGDLKALRDAIERFESTTGAWPPALTDLIAPNGAAVSADTDGSGGHVDRHSYDGPYLVAVNGGLPKDPFTELADWNYDNVTGDVHSSAVLTAVNGTAYNTW